MDIVDVMGRWLDIFSAIWTNVSWQFVSVVVDQQHNHNNPDIRTTNKQTAQLVPSAGAGNDNSIFVSVPTTRGRGINFKGFSSVLSFFNMSEDFAQ